MSVDGLIPISPLRVLVRDVAWLPETSGEPKLFLIGQPVGSDATPVYSVYQDGSNWSKQGNDGLPGAVDYITIAKDSVAWVSSQGTLWRQSEPSGLSGPGAWTSVGTQDTDGTAPVYAE